MRQRPKLITRVRPPSPATSEENSFPADGKEFQLAPGMAVTAEVKTDRSFIVEYFLTSETTHD